MSTKHYSQYKHRSQYKHHSQYKHQYQHEIAYASTGNGIGYSIGDTDQVRRPEAHVVPSLVAAYRSSGPGSA
eukprot:3941921-Rhodomonas_salina.7